MMPHKHRLIVLLAHITMCTPALVISKAVTSSTNVPRPLLPCS